MTSSRAQTLLALHILLLLMSLADVASKCAAGYNLLSIEFVTCYIIVLIVLAGYALGWQQVIKRMPLTTAYANRGITVVWGIFWGAVLFGEAITLFKVVGAVMVIAGIALFSHADDDVARASRSPEEGGRLGEGGHSGDSDRPGEGGHSGEGGCLRESLSPGEGGRPPDEPRSLREFDPSPAEMNGGTV